MNSKRIKTAAMAAGAGLMLAACGVGDEYPWEGEFVEVLDEFYAEVGPVETPGFCRLVSDLTDEQLRQASTMMFGVGQGWGEFGALEYWKDAANTYTEDDIERSVELGVAAARDSCK